MKLQDIGLIGLAVMGQNLVLNMERNGFGVAVYNRTASSHERLSWKEPLQGKTSRPLTTLRISSLR